MPIDALLQTYAQRWCLEMAFRDAKQHAGFERSQARTRKAVERTASFAFVTYAITVAWFYRIGHRHYPTLRIMPWYRHKRGPSFADMHALLRTYLLRQGFSHTPATMRPFEKTTKVNTHVQRRAA
jgi:hypothetical protein